MLVTNKTSLCKVERLHIVVHKYIDIEHVNKTIGMKTAERGVLPGVGLGTAHRGVERRDGSGPTLWGVDRHGRK